MAIKHVEIQIPDGTVVTQASLDELYIAMDNFDETSTVKGNVIIGNYTPSVINAIQEKYDITITPQSSAKKYIDIDPKYREVQQQFAKYSDDNSGHVTEEAAANVSTIVIDVETSEVWDFDGPMLDGVSWIDKFSRVTALPGFSFTSNVKEFKYTGNIKKFNGMWTNYTMAHSNIRKITYKGNVSTAASCFTNMSSCNELNLLDDTFINTTNMQAMITDNPLITSINLNLSAPFEIPKTISFLNAFKNNSSLKTITFRNWNITDESNISGMFTGSGSLEIIDALGSSPITICLLKAALNNANLPYTELQHDPITFGDSELAIKYSDLENYPNLEQIKKLGVGNQGLSNIIVENTTTFPTNLLKNGETWDFDGWYDDIFSTQSSIPSFANNTTVKSIKYSGAKQISTTIGCSNLEEVVYINVGLPTNMANFFINCSKLETVEISAEASAVTNMANMFRNCTSLTTLIGGSQDLTKVAFSGLNVALELNFCSLLDRASLRAVINGLADRTGQTQLTLTLGNTLKAKLTDEDILIATNKNWKIA